jgi:asparagine synthase (glutamine-hydrolysing)
VSGICGLVSSDPARPVDEGMLARMTASLRHRGPDGQGFYRAPGVGLGVQRLAVAGLDSEEEPVANEDGSVRVACDGAIYNAPELRSRMEAAGHRFRTRSHAEVIAHLYGDEGVDCLQRLRGMFALALWDTPRHRMILARDRLGIKPMHYATGPDGLCFGSELKAILATGRIARDLDVRALDQLFRIGFVIAPRTLFSSIRRLRPGEHLIYREGLVSRQRYWQPEFPAAGEPTPRRPAGEWAECLAAKLREVVRLHLRSDAPLGAWLSPGIDSSAVAALAYRQSGRAIPTFTLGFEDPEYDEVGHEKTLDRFAGYDLPNERLVCGAGAFALYPKALWHLESPTAGGTEIPRLILAEAAARRVKVVLTGEGSDEVFGGHPWHRWDRLLRPIERLPLPLRRLILLGPLVPAWRPRGSQVVLAGGRMDRARYARLTGPLRAELRDEIFTAAVKERLARARPEADDDGAEDRLSRWSPLAQLQYQELTTRLPDWVTHTLDRSAMAHGLEARVPFLDHELVELAARIPPRLKVRGGEGKHILRRALDGLLPPEILRRRKRGLRAPFSAWLRDPLPPFAEDLLSGARLCEKGYFVADVVRGMLERHRRRPQPGHGALLMAVLAVQLWDELFVKARGPLPS